MNRCVSAVLFALVMGACGPSGLQDPAAIEPEWIPLFNGRDLTGWIPKIRGLPAGEDPQDTFRVEDGTITVSYDGYPSFGETFGHLITRSDFSYYRLRAEYRFLGEQVWDGPGWAWRNSGIMIHGQRAEEMGIDQDFPISIEFQLLGGNGTDKRPTANLCTPGTHVEMEGALFTTHCVNADAPTFAGDGWVHVEAVVLGDSLITHFVEGNVVLEYRHPQIGGGNVEGYRPELKTDGSPLNSGTISLQSESHPVQFRRVDVLPLKGCMDSSSSAFRSWFVVPDPDACSL